MNLDGFRGDHDVAGKRNVCTGSGSNAVDASDDWLRQGGEGADQRVPAGLNGLAQVHRLARRNGAVVQVLASAEAAACAGQHDHARIAELRQRVAQLLVHLHGEAVEAIGTVERDLGDGTGFEEDGFVAAIESPPSP